MSSLRQNKEIKLQQLSVEKKSESLIENISLTLKDQLIYTVIGPSGSGKTTLLKVLAGLISPTRGDLLYGEEPYQAQRQLISYVPQNYGLLPWETVYQAVSRSLKISLQQKKLSHLQVQEIAQMLLELDLSNLKDKYPSQLSGGQKQRVAIARAFIVSADLLLMDEPFSALDALTREKTQQLFLTSWLKKPQTTVFITHDIQEALLLGDQIIVLADKPGTITQLIENPIAKNKKEISCRLADPAFLKLSNQLRKELV